jgi:serine/threonine protein kinase
VVEGVVVDRIITRLGLADHEPKVLHDRRGTTVYKIDNIALKITNGLMAAREGEILHLLGTEFYRDHGWDDHGWDDHGWDDHGWDDHGWDDHGWDEERSWLTLRWIEGTGLWTEFERAHRGDDSATIKGRMLALAAGAAQELAKLHAAGWAHGDLQPDHVILEGESTQIIDLARAQGPADVPFYVHRGGLAHTTAPEAAELILNSEEHIALTAQADIWSLGASLWWAWTRTTPITYTDPAAGRTAQLKDIAAAGRPDPSAARPWPFKELEEAVIACIATDPCDRPTAEHVATALR